jgi:hypothetical protein
MAELLSEARHHHDLRVRVLRYAARTPPLSFVGPWLLNGCRTCGWSMGDAETEQAHDQVRAVHRLLLAGKRSGWMALPGLEPMPWPPFVSGINALAEVIWVHGKPGRRRELFALIAEDVGVHALMPEEPPRKIGHGRARHDAMLVIAWLLERWRQRLMIAADVFGVTKRRWRVCSRPKPVRHALHALPWQLARDVPGVPKAGRILRTTHLAIRIFSMRPVACCWPATHACQAGPMVEAPARWRMSGDNGWSACSIATHISGAWMENKRVRNSTICRAESTLQRTILRVSEN